MAGGVSVFVPLRLNRESKQWVIDLDELESKISPRTKIVLLNTPHNPTGKVFTRDELERVADIVRRNPHITIVTDEVYEKLVYGGKEHIRLASLPGMWERTITVSSSGKTFSCTGWKVGWVFGAAHLVKPVVLANQWVQFSVSTPTQRALAEVITKASQPYEGHASYYEYVNKMYEGKRDRLVAALTNANLTPYVPDGGFFIMADTATIDYPESYRADPGPDGSAPVSRDWGFARYSMR
jgi:kynurenine--oxoglutarate transaminase/cysteine-S-conjugate beta-lyase/glutamine--phenylpyruvate transaminase